MNAWTGTDALDRLVNPDPTVITVWSDIGCPWATLALHSLRVAAEATQRELVVDHRAFPLELYNRRPTPKHIVDTEIVAIGGLAPDVGLRLWSGDPSTYPVSTLPALEAVQVAKDDAIGGLSVSTRLDAALRMAMYTDHRCISIVSEIEDVAWSVDGLDVEALIAGLHRGEGSRTVHEQWLVSRSDSIQGSPQILTSKGVGLHNPGVEYFWTAPPDEGGLPRLDHHDPHWAGELIDSLPGR